MKKIKKGKKKKEGEDEDYCALWHCIGVEREISLAY